MKNLTIGMILFAGSVAAQRVPTLGWIASDGGIRQLVGLPGTTEASETVARFSGASIAPGGRLAIVTEADGASLVALDGMKRLAHFENVPRKVVFAGDGAFVAMVLGDRLEVLNANADRLWTGGIEGELQALSHDGRLAVIADIHGVLEVYNGERTYALGLPANAAARFTAGGALLVSDRAAGKLLSVSQLTDGAVTRVVADLDAEDFIESADGRRIYALLRRDASAAVATIDAHTGQVLAELEAAPEARSFTRLGTGDTFLLVAPQERKPGWVFAANDGPGAVTFIPALAAAEVAAVEEVQ
jgi:hypothetical protein